MTARSIWIAVGERPDGPHAEAALAARLARGELAPDTPAWMEGMEAWTTLAALAPQATAVSGPSTASAAAVPTSTPAAPNTEDSVAVVSAGGGDAEALEAHFGALVTSSWRHYDQSVFAGRVDEVFLGAVITVMVERGSALIDLQSDGQNHYARFERLGDKSRTIVRVTHLTPGVVASRVQGHLVSIVVGYGEMVESFATVWSALKAEYRSGLIASPEPGTITVDGDMDTRYIYVQVDLIWNAGDYVGEGWSVDYERLGKDLDATQHVLRKYLRGRFRPQKEA